MKALSLILLSALFILSVPFGAAAMKDMDHGKHEDHSMHGEMDHSKHEMKHGEHGGMEMHGDMIMLGDDVEDGVKGMAHLKDVGEAMAKMGMQETHHFMIMLMDEASGEGIDTGIAALKIKTPSGSEGKAIKLMGMQGHFGADIALTEKGEYHFKVGTKVKDGKKRQFRFHYTVK